VTSRPQKQSAMGFKVRRLANRDLWVVMGWVLPLMLEAGVARRPSSPGLTALPPLAWAVVVLDVCCVIGLGLPSPPSPPTTTYIPSAPCPTPPFVRSPCCVGAASYTHL
jgi:hypothetical protein